MEFEKSLSQKLRMDGRDYARPGWYFVTLCADYHKHLFGAIEGVEMRANALGKLVEQCWKEIPHHYDHIELGRWQLMPNHFHGLVRIKRSGGSGLGEVINMFKGSVTRLWRKSLAAVPRHGEPEHAAKVIIWARNYWDVICFEPEQLAIRERYIAANPRRWALKGIPSGRIKQSAFIGNKALLKSTKPRRSLRVSRRASSTEIEFVKAELATFTGIVCSTFFSEGERECLKTLLAGSADIIWILPMTLPTSIPVAWTDAFLENRALWLSAFSDPDATRVSCQQANEWVMRFCGC